MTGADKIRKLAKRCEKKKTGSKMAAGSATATGMPRRATKQK